MTTIICCGNPDRGDDGAGFLVAKQLQTFGVPVKMCSGEATSLLDAWTGQANVVVVDAVRTGDPVGTIHRWAATEAAFPRARFASTHGFGVAEAIELARTLGLLPSQLCVYGIEAGQFEPGADPSAAVQQAAVTLAAEILEGLDCAPSSQPG